VGAIDLATLARRHLLLKLRVVDRALARAVERQAAAAARLARPDLSSLCVTDEQVRLLLEDLASPSAAPPRPADDHDPIDRAAERELRTLSGDRLPFDLLVRVLGLSRFEGDAILLCAAAEVDRAYGRIFAYILDDLNRRQPCVELLCSVAAPDVGASLARRREAGRFGRLRRAGLVLAAGDGSSELRQELRIAPALLEWLLEAEGDPAAFVDPADVPPASPDHVPAGVSGDRLSHLVGELSTGQVSVVGVFGPRGTGHESCVRAIAGRLGRPLRRLSLESAATLEDGLVVGAALGAIVWLEVDALTEPGHERLRQTVAERLARRRTPLVLSGVHPWRPAELLAARTYAEVELVPADSAARQVMWAEALPDADEARRGDLAARFRMSRTEVDAVARVARASARIRGNGTPLPLDDVLDEACATVARKCSDHFATLVRPRRGPSDLILAPDLHRQVVEIARFVRVLPHVSETWRFGRMGTGGGGLKALFTGDPGTGKTLAAEVVAGALGLPLLKVDLARVVSKWVGETEKHLETAFEEAAESHSILFFDEADALFGKRGEVSHGTDRYANLEVSYLLQRLEDHEGLVILASNLRDHIDEAFIRRFHVTLHFPRPTPEERRRLWQIALPPEAPLGVDVDLEALARLDLTGAGIVGTARTAALLAADEGAGPILMRHLVHAARRQFHREARLLTSADLGPYAHLLPGP
jgi:ATPase family protein associated with various cellular activities (AAA)/winged helix domain-containing protein